VPGVARSGHLGEIWWAADPDLLAIRSHGKRRGSLSSPVEHTLGLADGSLE
jgi:hypothetical protein